MGVNIYVAVISLVTILDVIPVRGVVDGIIGFVVGSVLSLKEWSSVSVSDVEAPGISKCKVMHPIDYFLWKG